MNASVELIPVTPRAPATLRAAPDAPAPAREAVLEIPGALSLYHGGRLSDARIAWRLVGAAHAPVVCALGGISANRHVCLTEDPRQGWWSEVVGPGGALDTHSFRVLSFDYLGGSGDSSGPQPAVSISSYDQAEPLVRLLDHLGVKSLAAIAGGSYGGMVGLAFPERFPERVGHVLTIGGADRSHPLATAWRSVQRHIVGFAAACGQPQEGLGAARARHDDLPQSRGARSPLQRGRDPRRGALRVPHRGVPVRARQRVRSALPGGVLPVPVRVHRSAPGRCGAGVRSDHGGGHSRRPAGAARGPAGARGAAAARASAGDFLHLRPRCLPQGVTAAARHISRGVRERPMSQTSDLINPLAAAANTSTSQVTQTVRPGIECGDATGCVVPPPHLSPTFAFRGFGDKGPYDYTRSGNPTRDLLAAALAELEQGVGAVVTASGMAAVTVVGYLVPAGGRIVAPHDCYGGTYRLFDAWRRRGERQVEFVDFGDEAAVREALARPAALLWIETPSNPLLRITDIGAVAALGHAAGAMVLVDNTFLSPAWQQPLALGADLVVHSTTKYLNGHSDVVGGAVVARDKALHEQLAWWANCLGLTGAPFDSYMTLRGLRTLHARLEHHGRNAHALAHWLREQTNVTRVW